MDKSREMLLMLCGSYFHPDWDHDADTPDGILRIFKKETLTAPDGEEQLQSAIEDIDEHIASDLSDDELARLIKYEYQCCYGPRRDWDTVRDWLKHVRAFLLEDA